MEAIITPLRVLVDPLRAMGLGVEQRRWFVPLLALMVASSVSGAIVALRLDVGPKVLGELGQSGELAKMSEREVAEALEQAQRVGLVAGVARCLLMPLVVFAVTLALRLAAYVFGKSTTMASCFSAAALGLLPLAVGWLALAMSASFQPVLSPKLVENLVPSSLASWLSPQGPVVGRIFQALEVFNLWAALLVGLGWAAATKASQLRGAGVGLLLYFLFAASVLVGAPGLMGAPP
jgi:hypothetical protein